MIVVMKAAFAFSNVMRDFGKGRETDRLLKEAQARKKADDDAQAAADAQRAKNAAAKAAFVPITYTPPAAAPPSKYAVAAPAGAPPSKYAVAAPAGAPPSKYAAANSAAQAKAAADVKAMQDKMKQDQERMAAQQKQFMQDEQTKLREMVKKEEQQQMAIKAAVKGPAPMIKEEAVKGMAPGQSGGMIGGASKEMGGDVKMIGKGLAQNLLPVNNKTMFGNIAAPAGGPPPGNYAGGAKTEQQQMAIKAGVKGPAGGAPPARYSGVPPGGAPPAKYAVAAPAGGPPPGNYAGGVPASSAQLAIKAAVKGPAPMMKDDAVKGMAPGQMGGMIGGASKDMGGDVKMIGKGLIQPGNYAGGVPPGGAPPAKYAVAAPAGGPPPGNYAGGVPAGGAPPAKYAVAGPAGGAPPAKYAVAGPAGGAPPAKYAVAGAADVKAPPAKYAVAGPAGGAPPGNYAGGVPASSAQLAIKAAEKGPAPMMKDDAVKAMAPGQSGGMIGGASKEMGGDVKMIGKGLAQKMEMDVVRAKEVPMVSKEVKNMPEAIAKKVDPEVKKIVDSFGKPASSEAEQKKMEVMKAMGVDPPKDTKDMEDLRKGIYRPAGKEIPGTGMIESLIKDLQAFASMLMKLVGGKQSGYTSGEMFGSTNSLVLIALVTAIILASRR
jgi:hypothetical protein